MTLIEGRECARYEVKRKSNRMGIGERQTKWEFWYCGKCRYPVLGILDLILIWSHVSVSYILRRCNGWLNHTTMLRLTSICLLFMFFYFVVNKYTEAPIRLSKYMLVNILAYKCNIMIKILLILPHWSGKIVITVNCTSLSWQDNYQCG